MKRETKRSDFIVIAGLLCTTLLWLWRLRLGTGDYDEAFYLTIPYRLTLGDTLLIDEWHVSQLSGFVTWPFMALYRWLVPNTTGIVLSFRGIWLFCHQGVAIIAYLLLRCRKHGGGGINLPAIQRICPIWYYGVKL